LWVENGTRITRMQRIFADLIRVNPFNPRHPRAIFWGNVYIHS
jgi:hypothetical protein